MESGAGFVFRKNCFAAAISFFYHDSGKVFEVPLLKPVKKGDVGKLCGQVHINKSTEFPVLSAEKKSSKNNRLRNIIIFLLISYTRGQATEVRRQKMFLY